MSELEELQKRLNEIIQKNKKANKIVISGGTIKMDAEEMQRKLDTAWAFKNKKKSEIAAIVIINEDKSSSFVQVSKVTNFNSSDIIDAIAEVL